MHLSTTHGVTRCVTQGSIKPGLVGLRERYRGKARDLAEVSQAVHPHTSNNSCSAEQLPGLLTAGCAAAVQRYCTQAAR